MPMEPQVSVAGMEKHAEYQAAKEESAVALDQQFRQSAVNSNNNSHNGHGLPRRVSSGSGPAVAAPPRSSFAEPSTVARVEHHDEYQTAKRESAVTLDQHAKEELRNHRTNNPHGHAAAIMDASTNSNTILAMEPTTMVRAATTSGMDLSSASLTTSRGSSAELPKRNASGDDLAAARRGGGGRKRGDDADARVKAGLRQSRRTAVPGVTSVPNHHATAAAAASGSSFDSSTTPLPKLLSQTESDARVKAGLRNRASVTTPGVAAVAGKNDLMEGSTTPPKLTQTESDARVKAGLRSRASVTKPGVAAVAAASISNEGSTAPPKWTQTESDAKVKAGLRNRASVSTPGVAVVGAAQMVDDDAKPGGSVSAAHATAINATLEADARLKSGLRAHNSRASATPGATAASNTNDVAAKKGLHSHSLRTAPSPAAITGQAAMVGASEGDATANAAVMREKERLFVGSAHGSHSGKNMDDSFNKKDSTQVSTQQQQQQQQQQNHGYNNLHHSTAKQSTTQPTTYVQMVKQDSGDIVEVDGGKSNHNRLWCILVVVVVIIGVVVGAVVGASSSSEDSSEDSPQEATNAPTQEPVVVSFDSLSDVFPTSTLPADTVTAIESQSSRLPQVQAYNWLLEDPNLSEYSESQRLQRFALMTLFYATNGEEWLPEGTTNNWGAYTEHECNWFSLAIQQGYTVCQGFDDDSVFDHYEYLSLVLSGNTDLTPNGPNIKERVRGVLPPELALLTSLRRLDIGFQKLRGPIPANLSSTLQDLVLYANDLSSTIPSDVFAFTQNLWLSHNDFARSSIPTTVGLNSNLQAFFCINCMLTGTIPAELFQSKDNLALLFLAENRLEGTIATEIGIATSLSEFRVSGNQISGLIPTEIGLLSGMTQLWLDLNKLEGTIVSELGSLTNLKSLSLGGNQLTSSLPTELRNLHQLRELRLSWRTVTQDFRNRDLNGTIPMEYFESEALETNVTDNTGTTSVVDQTNTAALAFPYLQQFWLADTKITGTLPMEIFLMTSLQSIVVGTNRQMTPSTIPTELGLLSNLVTLDLAEDNLESTIPSELGQLVQLEELTLEHNFLSGQIPSEFAALVSLDWFRVDGNEGLAGTVPNQLCQIETRGIGCSGDNVLDGGETSLCGCECPPCA